MTESFDKWLDTTKLRGYMDENSLEASWEAGQKSRQNEVDELVDTIKTSAESEMYLFDELQKVKSERDHLQKRVKELELINFDSELHFDAAKEHIDHLQKRVDEISNHVEINYDENRDDDSHSYWSGYNQALRELFEILKGDRS